jgi:murein DD-endopeptidase MepM/ murein hydrolase activator NlpD
MKKNLIFSPLLVVLTALAACGQLQPNPSTSSVSPQVADISFIYYLPYRAQESYPITQDYDPYPPGTCNGTGNIGHSGYCGNLALDIGTPTGTVIVAARAGQAYTLSGGGCGIGVRILHSDGSNAFYCHLDSVSIANNITVARGIEIGKSGNTGNSQGPHLHFEITNATFAGSATDTVKARFKEVIDSGVCSTAYADSCYPKYPTAYVSQNSSGTPPPPPPCNATYPAPPTGRTPGDPSTAVSITTTDITLRWDCVNNATSYGVYVSKEPYGGANLIVNNNNVAGISYTIPANLLQAGVRYRWNMYTFNNGNYVSTQISDHRYFTYNPVQPANFSITPNNMTFGGIVGGVIPVPQAYTISNSGGAGSYATFASNDSLVGLIDVSSLSVSAGGSATGKVVVKTACTRFSYRKHSIQGR